MEQCTEQQGAWNVPPRSLFISTFSPLPSHFYLFLSLFFSLVPGRGALLFLRAALLATLTPYRSEKDTSHRTSRNFTIRAFAPPENSVNSKFAERQRRLAVATHRVSLFSFHGFALSRRARATAGGKRVSLLRAVEPRNERSINHFPLIRTRSARYRLFRKEKRYDITIWNK